MNHLSIRDIFRTLFYCCFLSNSGKEVVNSINFPSRRKNRKADLVTCFESRTATPPLVSARVFRGIFCPIGYGSEGFKRSASPAAYRFSAEKSRFRCKKGLKLRFLSKRRSVFRNTCPPWNTRACRESGVACLSASTVDSIRALRATRKFSKPQTANTVPLRRPFSQSGV